MKLAMIGLEQSGKTTVFNALTGSDKEVGSYGKFDATISVVKVPDERIDFLTSLYEPKKTVFADIDFIDIPGSINDSADPKIIAAAREADALVFVIRSFDDENVLHPLDTIDPLRDFERIKTGLIVADMVIAEKRIERLKVTVNKPSVKQEEDKLELAALQKIMEQLESENPASAASLNSLEDKSIKSFQFLTLKPYMTLLNVSENDVSSPKTLDLVKNIPDCLSMCAGIEMEIRSLPPEDREVFLEELGLKELSLEFFYP